MRPPSAPFDALLRSLWPRRRPSSSRRCGWQRKALTQAPCLTPSTFWTSLGVPTCPSHGPGTVPSWLGTFASESPPMLSSPRERLCGSTAWQVYWGPSGIFFIPDLESLFCNKRGQSQSSSVFLISTFGLPCLWNCFSLTHSHTPFCPNLMGARAPRLDHSVFLSGLHVILVLGGPLWWTSGCALCVHPSLTP